MAKHKIAILVGSLREASINRKVARTICALEKDRLDCTIVPIGDLPLYNQEYDGSPDEPKSYAVFRKAIADADGILFVSPEYNRGIPGALKNAHRRRLAALWQERVEPQSRRPSSPPRPARSAASAPTTRSASRACSSTCR